jgi:hypothetical protein
VAPHSCQSWATWSVELLLIPGTPIRWFKAEGRRHVIVEATVVRQVGPFSFTIRVISGELHTVRRENLFLHKLDRTA